MKGIVDYKHPKKMKKRRQLDALVDTIKLPRSRKNSASAQELLDCHSDSSEIDELTLPQSNSKKKRCCICHSIAARIGLFMVTMACLTTCVGIIWVQWHLRHELESLRKQITSVQNSESVPADVLKIQSQLAEVNKSVINIKTGPYGLQEITNTITYIKSKLQELNDVNTKLQTSVSASKEVLGLPAKMNALSSMLATLGSDFKDFMNMQTSKFSELEKRVVTIETEVNESHKSSQNVLDDQVSQMLSQELTSYNISLQTGLQSFSRELERQSVRINTLEEFITSRSLSSIFSLNNTAVNDIVTKLLQEKLANMPAGINISESGLGQEILAGKIAQILQKEEQLNDTLLALRTELNSLLHRLERHDSTLFDFKKTVDSIKNAEVAKITGSSTVKPEEMIRTGSTESTPTHSGGIVADGDHTTSVIHIEGINTFEDLVRAFNESHNVKGQLDIETLNNIMNTTMQKEDLKHFDVDNNGLYSEGELAKALGFHKNPRR